jgi:hypothetical protein
VFLVVKVIRFWHIGTTKGTKESTKDTMKQVQGTFGTAPGLEEKKRE